MAPDNAASRVTCDPGPSKLLLKVRSARNLQSAWAAVRASALTSRHEATRARAIELDVKAPTFLRQMQQQLQRGSYRFRPQRGIKKVKKGAIEPRPLVSAELEDRVLQRALLQVVQAHPAVRPILDNPYSFGGIESKGVAPAIKSLVRAIGAGDKYFVRSDIKNFFGNIPRKEVLARMRVRLGDEPFCDLLDRASETNIGNPEDIIGNEHLFPTDTTGVPQGSALSALFGNVLLHEVDVEIGSGDVHLVRYIDDLVVTGRDQQTVEAAFGRLRKRLRGLGLELHVPGTSKKAAQGLVRKGIQFLGLEVRPGSVWPERDARTKLLRKISGIVDRAIGRMDKLAAAQTPENAPDALAQALVKIDRTLDGWAHAYAFCTVPHVMRDLDAMVDSELARLIRAYRKLRGTTVDRAIRRRLLGVRPLADVPSGSWVKLMGE